VRGRTRDGYEASLRLHILPLLGDRLLSSLTALDGKELVATMRAAERSDNTMKNAVTPLRPPPTREEVEAIIEKARREDAREAIRVAAATGLRRGELFALRWSDVDFEARTIHVHASNYAGKINDQTKTEAGARHVPLFRSIRQLPLERKARQRFSAPDDFVFGTSIGAPMDPGNFVRREFRPALKAAGLAGVRWHDLRHFAVSALIADGADIKLLPAIAGHANATVTLDVYGHLMRNRVTEAADRFDPMAAIV
jgi:integrase